MCKYYIEFMCVFSCWKFSNVFVFFGEGKCSKIQFFFWVGDISPSAKIGHALFRFPEHSNFQHVCLPNHGNLRYPLQGHPPNK